MSAIAIIPARYASSRLPGKPLLAETGKPLIQHCVESVGRAKLIERIVVATDDRRIADAVAAFAGEAVMTSAECRTGTDRLAEAAGKLGLADDDIVVNVQGDEPDMPGECIDRLVVLLGGSPCPMATLATPLACPELVEGAAAEAADPNKVKVALRRDGRAMYFSRAPIPFDRQRAGVEYLWHLGIYAYRVKFLRQYAALDPTPAEQAEKLEQLRALESGFDIAVGVVDYDGQGIDTPEDYAQFVARMRGK